MKKKRPDIGSTLWIVHEHLYYVPEHVAPVKEYVVLPGKVIGYFEGGYVEICMKVEMPGSTDVTHYVTPIRRKLSDLGKTSFFTAREAALLAQKLTDAYNFAWGWCEESLRRPWERYLAVRDGSIGRYEN